MVEWLGACRDAARRRNRNGSIAKDATALLVILGLSTLVMLPVFVRGFPAGDDLDYHYAWTTQFTQTLREGDWYPRWSSHMYEGQGGPVMLLYPPLPFYMVALLRNFAGDDLRALSLGCWLALSLSGLTMYLFCRALTPRRISLLAAAFYIIAPYHLFDLYQRAALSELWSFAWLPLVLDAARRMVLQPGRFAVPYLAGSYALLLLTHVPTSAAVSLSLPIYVGLLGPDARQLIRCAVGAALGVGMGAAYVVPAALERQYVQFSQVAVADYARFFLLEHIEQAVWLILLRWQGQEMRVLIIEAVTFALLGLVVLFVCGSLCLWHARRSGQVTIPGGRLVRAVWVMTLISLLMTTRVTQPVWEALPLPAVIQFPYRWLVIATAGVAVLTGAALSAMRRRRALGYVYGLALVVVLLFCIHLDVLTMKRIRYRREIEVSPIEFSLAPEHRPVWLQGRPDWVEGRHEELRRSTVVVDSGDARIGVFDNDGQRRSFSVSATTQSTARFYISYFPGWVAHAAGRPVEISPSQDGNIQTVLEPGEYDLTLTFEDTWPRTLGKVISALSLLVALLMTQSNARRFWKFRLDERRLVG